MRKEALIDTYLDQVLTGPGGGPVPAECFVFGTATPDGPADWDALHERQRLMIDRLTERGIHAEPGYAVGALRSFVEPVVFAIAMGYEQAAAFLRKMGVSLYVQRADREVYLLSGDEECLGMGPACLAEDIGGCVMPNAEVGEVCVMRGGPFGSRAIRASLDWHRERTRLIAAFGCDTCHQGTYYRMRGAEGQLCSGGPIGLVAHEVTTRFTAMVELTHG